MIDNISEKSEYKARKEEVRANCKIIKEELKTKLDSSITIKNVLNAIFIISISCICFQQCYVQVSEYLKYSVRSQISHSFPNSTLFLIPGVTICNNNRVRMEKLKIDSPLLKQKLDDFVNNLNALNILNPLTLTEEMRIKRIKSVQEIVENTVNISSLISDKPISRLLDLSRCSLVRDIDCNGIWGKQFNCENFRLIESFQGVACYTLFYLGSILEALSNELAFDFNTTLLGGKKKINSFDEHEIADILVDFEPYEHADFQRDIGGKIVIHSTGHVGSIRDMSYSIQPGRKYEILLSRRMTKRLPPPYKSMCVDYRGKNSHEFTMKQGSPPSVVLDTTGCTRNCIVKLSTKTCNCWPPEIPYFPNDQSIVDGAQNYRACTYLNENGQQQNSNETVYVNCYKKLQSDCRNECHRGCWTEDYKQHIITSQWPSRNMFVNAMYEFEKKELRRLKHCCAKISLKYMSYMETKQIMNPTLTLAQLVSNIGGIVSGLIGVSAVTLYRYMTRNILRCKVVSDYKPQSNKS